MDQRKRELSKEKEKQRKLLLMKQEEEKLEQLLQRQHDEELQQLKRIEMLQQKELLMRKEVEVADIKFALSIKQGARPKVYDELQSKTKEDNIAEIEGKIVAKREKEFDKREEREIASLQGGSILKRQQELHIEGTDSDRVQSSSKQQRADRTAG